MKRAASFIHHYLLARRSARRWQDRVAFDSWREARVLRHIDRVRRKSPFYRELWAGIADADWRAFPEIDKSAMMAGFDRLNTVGIAKSEAFAVAEAAERSRDFSPALRGITVGLSSGTSGNRGLFLVSPEEQAAWAGTVLGKLLPVSPLSRFKIAFFLRANSNLYASVGGRRLKFGFYDLLDPIDAHLRRLMAEQPDLIAAPPSMLRMLADAVLSGSLEGVRPRRIIAAAEVLDPLDRAAIERAFGQPVHQVYQCTEGFLGCTCAHGTLHLNEDLVYIEKDYVPDKPGTFVPIVTDFSRRTQPIVRYRLNDLLVERTAPCPCGSPFTAIERIEGRCDDIFYASALQPDAAAVPVYPDFVTRAIMGASVEIEQYRAVQTAPDRWTIEFDLRNGDLRQTAESRIRQAVEALCERLSCVAPELSFTSYARTPGDRKLRRVERRYAP
ncbi:F390 synthetase-related protein [Cohnella hashimotonis]|uniref:Adenylate cyclase n=1 Tax=Cohnella hashimotonis TaxID=2826895 RepID=A0ABT6TRM8_9BACL|nr:F390 synthetase-related protein [Cohnella hashimotonis]MDI4649186.1 adenylate cyclase [Cohnella hashimotonis]